MTDKVAWSWSRLDCFEKCPRQFYERHIKKTIPFEQNDAMRRGERIHKHIENAIKGGSYDPEIKHMVPMIEKIRGANWDEQQVETEYALRDDMKRTSWFGKDAWCRIKMDYIGIKGSKAVTYDWKSGKNRGYSDQLKLYGGAILHLWKEVEEVETAYVFVDSKQVEKMTYYREDYQNIWDEFGERQELIQICNETNDWQEKPGAMACRFCPVECERRY